MDKKKKDLFLFLLLIASWHVQTGGGSEAAGDWAGGRPEAARQGDRDIRAGGVACAGKNRERVVNVRLKSDLRSEGTRGAPWLATWPRC